MALGHAVVFRLLTLFAVFGYGKFSDFLFFVFLAREKRERAKEFWHAGATMAAWLEVPFALGIGRSLTERIFLSAEGRYSAPPGVQAGGGHR